MEAVSPFGGVARDRAPRRGRLTRGGHAGARPTTLGIIEQANVIIAEFETQGFTLTLRQLYYQFVARDLIANKPAEYKRLGTIIKDARRAGLIDWNAIEDRTRNVRTHAAWDDPADIIESAAESYREDLWASQNYRPEVWLEKDALMGVIEGICAEYRVPYFACRGNNSESEQYKAGKRFQRHLIEGLIPVVLHLGDHDPNGLDMTRDNRERLAMFAGRHVEVRRLALNIDQVRGHRLPPNPAKETDSRYASYARQFGPDCWELDALDPTVIVGLIRAEIDGLIDAGRWRSALAEEQRNRGLLAITSGNWAKVENILRGDRS
jgi:hypothetical protein